MARGRVDAEERREWHRLSHLLAAIVNVVGGGKREPQELNPYHTPREVAPEEKEHVSLLRDVFGGGKHSG